MKTAIQYYEIDRHSIEWGKPLEEVRAILEKVNQFRVFVNAPWVRYKCSSIFGLAATECEIKAPSENRPVLEVQYHLGPKHDRDPSELYTPYLHTLEQVFGIPQTSHACDSKTNAEKKFTPDVFNASWFVDGFEIGLTVYGRNKKRDSGLEAAHIAIHWKDLVKAAKPFAEKNKIFEKLISEHISKKNFLKKTHLEYKQMLYIAFYSQGDDPYRVEKNKELRLAQMAMFKKELFQTPDSIHSQLEENEVAFYTIPNLHKFFVSTRWDTVFLTLEEESQLSYHEIYPGRSAGERALYLKEMVLKDAQESNALLELSQMMEQAGLKIIKYEVGAD